MRWNFRHWVTIGMIVTLQFIMGEVKSDSAPTAMPTVSKTSSKLIERPSAAPTHKPLRRPTTKPTAQPTSPTAAPTSGPSAAPSVVPTSPPSSRPSVTPTSSPSSQPTSNPSTPTALPTTAPSSLPSSQPTSNPTQPTRHRTSRPSSIPTSRPTQGPTTVPLFNNNKWFYQFELDNPAIFWGMTISAVCGGLTILSFGLERFYSTDGKPIRLLLGTLNLIAWALISLAILIARLEYILSFSNKYFKSNYIVSTVDDVPVARTPVWPGPGFNQWADNLSSPNTQNLLHSASCIGGSFPAHATTELDGSTGLTCQFLFFHFAANLRSGEADFTLGLGIAVVIILQIAVTVVEIAVEVMESEDEEKGLAEKVAMKFIMYFFSLFVMSQQGGAMIPLTSMEFNPYCAVDTVPKVTQDEVICNFVRTANSIPWAFYTGLATTGSAMVCAYLAGVEDDDAGCGLYRKVLVFMAGLVTAYCAFMCVSFIIWYIFAGFVLGLWYSFAEVYNLNLFFNQFFAVSTYMLANVLSICLGV